MFSGCKLLQVISAIVIVLMIIMTVFLIMGAIGASGAAAETEEGEGAQGKIAAMGVAGVLVWAVINIGITALFMKVFRDCAKRQDILAAANLPRKPKELAPALKNLQTSADLGSVAMKKGESVDESPIVASTSD